MTDFATRTRIIAAVDQPVLSFLGGPERLMLGRPDTNGEFALFESSGVRGHTAPTHRHRIATETFIVLDGELLVQVGDDQHRARAGDVALLPRGLPHTFVVVSPTARYLTLHTPAGFDDFVRAVSDLASANRAALTAVATDHGIEILGPGLNLPGDTAWSPAARGAPDRRARVTTDQITDLGQHPRP